MHRSQWFQNMIRAGILICCLAFAGAAFAQYETQSVTLTGWVSCMTCLQPNTCRMQTRSSCVAWWVNQGSAYALVVGTRNYRLLGADKELAKFAGDTVTITGDAFRSAVNVTSIEGVKVKEK